MDWQRQQVLAYLRPGVGRDDALLARLRALDKWRWFVITVKLRSLRALLWMRLHMADACVWSALRLIKTTKFQPVSRWLGWLVLSLYDILLLTEYDDDIEGF